MPVDLFSLLKIFTPTLILLLASSSPAPFFRGFHEVYSSGNWYLDMYFDLNPRGAFRQPNSVEPVRFIGFLVRGDKEEKVTGMVRTLGNRRFYSFTAGSGRFEGETLVHPGRCQPQMSYQFFSNEGAVDSDRLTGAFCP